MTKRSYIITFIPLTLLLIPLIAMQFSNEIAWSLGDFVIMGGLLLILGFGISLVVKLNSNKRKRLIYISLIILIFLLIWAELGVGIFGSPFAGS